MEKRIIAGLDQSQAVIDHLKSLLSVCQVFTFNGTLGAGKTTLVRMLLQQCGVEDVVTSPTFTYVNLYKNKQGKTFYHFDLYRIQTLDDFVAAGFDEYLYEENSISLIEWPELIQPLLKNSVCNVVIKMHGFDKREFIITAQE